MGQATVPGSPRQQGKQQKRQQNRINDSYLDEDDDDLVREAGREREAERLRLGDFLVQLIRGGIQRPTKLAVSVF